MSGAGGRRSRWRLLVVWLTPLLLGSSGWVDRGVGRRLLAAETRLVNADGELTAARVQQSIDEAVRWLGRQQRPDGRWPGYESWGVGQTALVTLSLLTAGLPPSDPVLARALGYLREQRPTNTYALSLHVMALAAGEPRRDLPLIAESVAQLVQLQRGDRAGSLAGAWPYAVNRGGGDPSNTQFALLALWEAQRVGVEVSADVFERSAGYWRRLQKPDGGWGYDVAQPATGSMTCAGIASMLIIENALDRTEALVLDDRIVCCGGDVAASASQRGLAWLARNFSATANPNFGAYWLYYLYALERVGRLTGQRFIGQHDWYREGAEAILTEQRRRQALGWYVGGLHEEDRITSTCLGLLFLSKGKRQVVLGRLQHGTDDQWRAHLHGMQNLTGQVERVWKRDLSWQSVQLEEASVTDLLQVPVLVISGSAPLKLDARSKRLLKEYVEQGGFLLAEAIQGDDCPSAGFETWFRELVQELFEQPLQRLPVNHPIWMAEGRVAVSDLPEDFYLYGLEACCRTSVIFSPISLSCRWELDPPVRSLPSGWPPAVQRQLRAASLLGVNIVSYATGREVKEKLDSVQLIDTQIETSPPVRGQLALARLANEGGPEDVPRAIPNLVQLLEREVELSAGLTPGLLSADDSRLSEHLLLYLHGRRDFRWSDSQQQRIGDFLRLGGFVMGDAVCGSPDFARAAKSQLQRAVPEGRWEPVPVDHPMLTDAFGGFDVRRVSLITPQQERDQFRLQRRDGPPVLEMLILDERVVAVFSPYDISCALESPTVQCAGYARQDAARIAINLILFAHLQ
jgi:hypothetical protein